MDRKGTLDLASIRRLHSTGIVQNERVARPNLALSQSIDLRRPSHFASLWPRDTLRLVADLPPHGTVATVVGAWSMRFGYMDFIAPTQLVSNVLYTFYQRLLELAELHADAADAMDTISLGLHYLSLDFECDSAAISWDFIKSFVLRMLDATARGFTSRFLAHLTHAPTQTVIQVTLSIVQPDEP
ncbi:hypothetical protein ACLMJK_007388 [Lecanora helva]